MQTSIPLIGDKTILMSQSPSKVAKIDAIIIPSARPNAHKHIRNVLKIANGTGSFVVVLCSGRADARGIRQEMLDSDVSGVAINIPGNYNYQPFSRLLTTNFADALYLREGNDVSIKRNLGLLFAHVVGWGRIFFLDDDLEGIHERELAYAAQLLENNALAGFLVKDFPDHSVIRHAERLIGRTPEVNFSGGALAVNTAKVKGFFPKVYNEDWFFIFENGTPALAGTVYQDGYNPFANPQRAISEEFGDLIAEGLLSIRQAGGDYAAMTVHDWQQIISVRKNLIASISKELKNNGSGTQEAYSSLQAAAHRLNNVEPATCVRYVQAWQKDCMVWHEHIASLRRHVTLEDALRTIGVTGYFS